MNLSTSESEGANPVSAIVLAISVAAMMVLVTFTVFLHSSAYTTVKQIQAGTKIARAFQGGNLDTRSPIKADDITAYEKIVQQRLGTLDDKSDLGADDVTDAHLAL